MNRRTVQVECYSGGRADERPRRIIIAGHTHVVARLLSSAVERSPASEEETHRYSVETEEGLILRVARDSGGDWHLESVEPGAQR